MPTYKSGQRVDDYSGLVEIINDPDKNGVFLIHNEYEQKFVILFNNGKTNYTQTYNLENLILNPEI